MTRRDDILSAALRVIDERGALGAGIEEIRRASGASIGSIYHHFAGKEGIVAALYSHVLRSYQDAFLAALHSSSSARGGIGAAVDAHLRWAVDRPAEMRLLLELAPPRDAVREQNRRFFAAVRAWWTAQDELPELDFALAHALWLGPATELCRHWLAGQADPPGPAERDLLSGAAWRSLTT